MVAGLKEGEGRPSSIGAAVSTASGQFFALGLPFRASKPVATYSHSFSIPRDHRPSSQSSFLPCPLHRQLAYLPAFPSPIPFFIDKNFENKDGEQKIWRGVPLKNLLFEHPAPFIHSRTKYTHSNFKSCRCHSSIFHSFFWPWHLAHFSLLLPADHF